jgi:hypothetical protein
MDGETARPPRSKPPTPASEGASVRSSEHVSTERFGPLEVGRHRKDDGRALLLYELREGEQ